MDRLESRTEPIDFSFFIEETTPIKYKDFEEKVINIMSDRYEFLKNNWNDNLKFSNITFLEASSIYYKKITGKLMEEEAKEFQYFQNQNKKISA